MAPGNRRHAHEQGSLDRAAFIGTNASLFDHGMYMDQPLTGFENPDTDFILAALDERYSPKRDTAFKSLMTEDPAEPGIARAIISMLAGRAFSLQTHMKRAFREGDIQYLSWAARSLLELKFFTEFCLSSDQNMARFKKDAFIDASTALQVTTKNVRAISDMPIKQESEKTLSWIEGKLNPTLDSEGVTLDGGFLSVSGIARHFNAGQEFGIVNMMFSKFAHTTAMSTILPFQTEEQLKIVRALLLQVGAMNAVYIVEKLAEFSVTKGYAEFAG